MIQRDISDEPITGQKRIARMEDFSIASDLEMTLKIKVYPIDENRVLLADLIYADQTIDPQLKTDLIAQYDGRTIVKQTRGAFIDPVTQDIVEANAPGAVPELAFFQGITIGMMKQMGMTITDSTPFSSLLYAMIDMQIGTINARGKA